MYERYRVQLNLASVIKLSALLGFGVGIVVGLAMMLFTIANGGSLAGSLSIVLLSPFSNAAGTALVALLGYPFYNWYCNRNRGQILSGRFLKEESEQAQ